MPFHFFIIFGSLYRSRRAVWEILLQGKTLFNSHRFFLPKYFLVLKSPSLCPYMLQTDYSLNTHTHTHTHYCLMLYENLLLPITGSRVQLHQLTHAQFLRKAHRSETKFEKGASDKNLPPGVRMMTAIEAFPYFNVSS